MKTYTKEIEAPQLEIWHDGDSPSPREQDNLGYFLTKESRYPSPDGNTHRLYEIMNETAEEAKNAGDHVERIFLKANEEGISIDAIYPIYRYEHGGIAYHRGIRSGFDVSNCGFYIVTTESKGAYGDTKGAYGDTKRSYEDIIDHELEEYTKWANGEVYGFTLYSDEGGHVDSCGGFYDIDDIHGALPDGWENEDLTQYIVTGKQ